MGQVRWTAEAETWLREIHDFIAKDNPAAAFRTVQRIYEKADVLLDHPEIGYLYRSSTGRPIRILLFEPGERATREVQSTWLRAANAGDLARLRTLEACNDDARALEAPPTAGNHDARPLNRRFFPETTMHGL